MVGLHVHGLHSFLIPLRCEECLTAGYFWGCGKLAKGPNREPSDNLSDQLTCKLQQTGGRS